MIFYTYEISYYGLILWRWLFSIYLYIQYTNQVPLLLFFTVKQNSLNHLADLFNVCDKKRKWKNVIYFFECWIKLTNYFCYNYINVRDLRVCTFLFHVFWIMLSWQWTKTRRKKYIFKRKIKEREMSWRKKLFVGKLNGRGYIFLCNPSLFH